MPTNRYSNLKIHFYKRTICNKSHDLTPTTYKQIPFDFDDKELLNVNTYYEKLEQSSHAAMELFNLHELKGFSSYGSRRIFLVQTREYFDENMYQQSSIKFQPKLAVAVCFIKYSELNPKAIPINEYQGIFLTIPVKTYLQMRPSYKLPNYMCDKRFNKARNRYDVWENIAMIYDDFVDFGKVEFEKNIDRRQNSPPDYLTIQMAVSRMQEEFYNFPGDYGCSTKTQSPHFQSPLEYVDIFVNHTR